MNDKVNWAFVIGEEGDWAVGYVPNIRDDKGRVHSGTTIVAGFDLGQQSEASIRALKLPDALAAKLMPFVRQRGPDAVMATQRGLERGLDQLLALNRQQTGSGPTTVGRLPVRGIVGNAHGPLTAADGSWRTPAPGRAATHFVADTPLGLALDETERKTLMTAVKQSYVASLAKAYDLCAPACRFADQPSGIQTGLLSLRYQMGSIWRPDHVAHEVFDAAVRQDWRDAVDSLRGSRVYWLPRYFKFRDRRRAEARQIAKAAGIEPGWTGPKERAWLSRTVEEGSLRRRTA